jgi:hypothetical protein
VNVWPNSQPPHWTAAGDPTDPNIWSFRTEIGDLICNTCLYRVAGVPRSWIWPNRNNPAVYIIRENLQAEPA